MPIEVSSRPTELPSKPTASFNKPTEVVSMLTNVLLIQCMLNVAMLADHASEVHCQCILQTCMLQTCTTG